MKNSTSKIEVTDPQDGSPVGYVASMTEDEVKAVVDSSVAAFGQSQGLPVSLRIRVLAQVIDALQAQQEEFAQLIAREGIKTIREARKEVGRCIDTLRLSQEEARRITGETIPFDQSSGSENRFGYFRRVPIGVVVAITPFNDPLNLVVHKIGPAIAAGNAVILKPHSETPLVAQKLVGLFHKTALPKGFLSLVTGRGAVIGNALVSDPRIRMVSFTGGREVGEKIYQQAGLKKIALELGSNCPAIVMEDADIGLALEACISGAFWAAGQNCLHVQRILLHHSIYPSFKDRFCQRANLITMGKKMDESTDIGPLINEAAAKKVEWLVNDALQNGATLLCGGERRGNFYSPTVLADVTDHCAIAREEVFGPVTVLYSFATTEQAIALANNVDYGLQAGVFTESLNRAFQISNALEVGGVMINDSSDYRIDAMPFGGVKGSGLGREGVAHAVHEMTELKTYCFNLNTQPQED